MKYQEMQRCCLLMIFVIWGLWMIILDEMCEKLILKRLTLSAHQDTTVHRSCIAQHILSVNKSRLLTRHKIASILSIDSILFWLRTIIRSVFEHLSNLNVSEILYIFEITTIWLTRLLSSSSWVNIQRVNNCFVSSF